LSFATAEGFATEEVDPLSPNLNSSSLKQLKSTAIALEGNKKHEEALAKYDKVLAIQQRDLPPGHLDTHETLMSIDRVIEQLKYASVDNGDIFKSAYSLQNQGKDKEAYSLFEHDYERLLVTHGADHPETLVTRYSMAVSLYDQKRHIDALSMFEPLLKKQRRVLPLDDPDTLKTMVDVAGTLFELDRHDEALKMYEDVISKLIRVRGKTTMIF
jgi:tetratricopeptide (TPR) repeat protein